MTFLAHSLMGVAAGEITANPIIAFTVSIPLHLAVDRIPHFWPVKLMPRLTFQAIDVLFTLAVVYFALTLDPGQSPSIIAGVAGSLVVDFALANSIMAKRKLGQWHTNRQPHKTNFVYLSTDIILSIIGLIIIYFVR